MNATPKSLERQARALELHLAGMTYDAIAATVGYASRSGAYKAVQEALAHLGTPVGNETADTELARLDAMLVGLWAKARRGDVYAVDRVLKIGERRAQILTARAVQEPPEAKGNPLDELARRRAQSPSAPSLPRSAGDE